MSNEFLDKSGLTYFWSKLKAYFVAQEDGMGLSSNDFTDAEKEKLASIEEGATAITVDSALSSTSTNPVENQAVYAALEKKVDTSLLGVANGVATLDDSGLVPSTQLPSYVDDVIEGYLYDGVFYEDSSHKMEITGESGKIYVDLNTNYSYRYSSSAYVQITSTDMTAITNDEIDEIMA
ncbi:MAG: hypothetical protein LIO74_08790 [Ruminococcus sp.]|nr:hypothetical protein [Ruminococcus sp.]